MTKLAAGISSACVLSGVHHGLGRRNGDTTTTTKDNEVVLKVTRFSHARSQAILTVTKLLWVSDIFYPITLSIAKGAALPLLIQLTRLRKFILACYALAVFILLWGFLSVVILAARCHLESPWTDSSTRKCASLYGRWVAIEAGSLLIEVLIFIEFVSIIRILKMRRTMKLKLMIAFATRLPVIIPTIFRLIYLRNGLSADKDTIFALTNAIIATQVVLYYTTMASSLAYLKPFLRAFDSNLGATVKVDTVVSTGYTPTKWNEHSGNRGENKDNSHTYPMRRLDQSGKSLDGDSDDTSPSKPIYQQTVHSPTSNSVSKQKTSFPHDQQRMPRNKYSSRESMMPMITKTQEWHVSTEIRDER